MAELHESLGLAHWRADRFDSALVHLLRTRDLRSALADSAGLARALNSLGSTHYQVGNYGLAIDAYVRALGLRAAAGNVLGQSYIYSNIGKAYEDWRQFDRALATLDSAVAFAERAGDGHALGYALNTRAGVLIALERYDDARREAEQSLAAYFSGNPKLDAVDSASAWSINTMLIGRIDLAQGRTVEARRQFAQVLAAAERGRTFRGQAQAHIALGSVAEATREYATAVASYSAALRAAESINNRAQRLDALAGLSRAEEGRGNAAVALRVVRRHDALRDSIFDARTAQRVATAELEAKASLMAATQQQQAQDLRRQRVVTVLVSLLFALTLLLVASLWRFNRKLGAALAEVQTLSGFIPICASCKNVRDDAGYWQSVEAYIASRSAAQFSHSICNSCGPRLYGEDWPTHHAPPAGGGH
jgi:tetratricopeptide (TPR) repeat protein